MYKIVSTLSNYNENLPDILYITNGIEEFHNFLFKFRDPYKENLITIIHPWESGLDNSPTFDEDNKYSLDKLDKLKIQQQIKDRKDLDRVISAFRPGEKDYNVYGKLMGYFKKYNYNQVKILKDCPFRVQDLLYNVILCMSIKNMIKVYKFLFNYLKDYKYKKLIQANKNKLQKLKIAIKTKLYNKKDDSYYSYSLNLNRLIQVKSIQSLISYVFIEENKNAIIHKIKNYNKSNQLNFLTVPSSSKYFNSAKYWRGPIWPIINWLIIENLKKSSSKYAIKFAKETINLISENYSIEQTYFNAQELMKFNLVFDSFTTPSKNQYKHGWLWDSAFASIGWNHILNVPSASIYQKIYDKKQELIEKNTSLHEIRKKLKEEYKIPLFDEYYIGVKSSTYSLGEPIGSEMMTWTAAIYIDLYNFIHKT